MNGKETTVYAKRLRFKFLKLTEKQKSYKSFKLFRTVKNQSADKLWLCIVQYLYLYLFRGRIQFLHLQPRCVRFKKLVALMDSFSEAVNCLCADVTLFQFCLFALRPKSTAMVIAGRSVHLATLFPGQA